MTLPQDWRVYGVLALSLVGLYLFAKRELVAGVQTVAEAVNPLDAENVFHSGVNKVGAAVSGNRDWSLGVAVWEWWNADRVEAERRAIEGTAGLPR